MEKFVRLIKSQRLPRILPIIYTILLVCYLFFAPSKGTHNTDNFVDWINGFINGDFFDLYHVIPFEGVLPSESLMVPYPPFSLYILGAVAKVITLFVPETRSSILIASNLTAILFTFLTAAVLEFRRRIYNFKSPIIYLLTPTVFLMSPLLGYQDSIMTFFILCSFILAQKKLHFFSGVLAAMAVFSKQLAVMPIFGLGLLILLSLDLKVCTKFAGGFIAAFLVILSPFIFTGTLAAYFQAQGLASVHTMMSAQNPNLPWLLSLIIRISNYGFFSENTYSSLPLRIEEDLIRQILYLGFGLLTVLCIVLWLTYWKWYKKISCIEPMFVGAVAICAYNLLSFGVHENHVFMVLPILFAITGTKVLDRAYFFMSIALAVNLIATGGLGRSVAHFPLITQESGELYVIISGACFIMYLLAFRDLVRVPPVQSLRTQVTNR